MEGGINEVLSRIGGIVVAVESGIDEIVFRIGGIVGAVEVNDIATVVMEVVAKSGVDVDVVTTV